MNRWDKMLHDAGNAAMVEQAKKELVVIEEPEAKPGVLVNISSHIEAQAKSLEERAESATGGLALALKNFAAKLRSGEETLTEEVKAELEKIGVKF